MTMVLLVAAVVGAALAWRRGARWLGGALAFFGVLVLWRLVGHLGWWLTVPALLAGGTAWHLRSRTASRVTRWGARSRRKSGVASSVDIARVASGSAVRRKASSVRPELTALPRSVRGAIKAVDVGIELCRVGIQLVWSSVEDVTLIFGGPRTGKTGWLAGRVLDAQGALLVTSTRTDLLELTGPLRARRGPVYVFNAVGLGGHPSTITFDPLTGCADPVTAAERAGDLLGAGVGAGHDREFWDAQARRVLAALMHAAALGEGLTMREVLRWVADPDGAQREVTSLLRSSPSPELVQDATQFIATNDRTRTSITSTIMPALGWLTSPAASTAASGDHPFVVANLLDSSATVYLLGAEETQAAPLVCALTGYVAREARRLAATRPSGRLDPPLTLALDEAALISPVPLQSWTADMGGRGVTIIAAFQSRAQVIARWGETGGAIILNNAASVMVFGGTRDRDDLAFWSTLAGERDEPVTTTDMHGRAYSRTVRRVPVLAPSQIANLPAGTAVVFRRGIPPVVGHVRMAWRRRDVRAHARAQRADQRSLRFRARWDAVMEGLPDALASRWPDRFAGLARRVHDAHSTRRDRPASTVVDTDNVVSISERRT
ncbi:type IV secretory system conjugative DNA transfer family protein [Pseudonocardia parietis]|uniref:Type IV secretory pathway TraG/TraD family ATPase VirD4 n=1 Tax=Pseudonocardia parietis TaxID=570936 RepID=A0ABS4W126_9PSEU|nr:TraM recognition domain-containing protein [Pseudonocardia parietis]MBP2369912.1 type IV secretory pathway TraG/TraD family ATPase VirD4 [Pseudonocardia parietis]